jgi:hypothetical protein
MLSRAWLGLSSSDEISKKGMRIAAPLSVVAVLCPGGFDILLKITVPVRTFIPRSFQVDAIC